MGWRSARTASCWPPPAATAPCGCGIRLPGSPLASFRLKTGPGSRVNGVAFSPDGKLLASANGDTTIGLWNPVTGQASGGFSGRNAVAFSPDGKLLAAADTDGTVRLWDLATRQAVGAPLPADPGGSVLGVAFSPDSTLLATADTDGHVRLWNLATGRAVGAPLPGDPGGRVLGVAFSPDGKLLASADGDGTVRLWNPGSGQPVGAPFPAVTGGGVNGVAFSPDGKLLAAAYSDGMRGCGTWPPGRPSAFPSRPAAWLGGACPAWPSARTASSWPPPTPTAPCGCGKCRFSLTRTQHSAPMPAHRQRQNGRITPRVNRSPACADDTCRFRPVPDVGRQIRSRRRSQRLADNRIRPRRIRSQADGQAGGERTETAHADRHRGGGAGGPQALGKLTDQLRRAADDGFASFWMSNIFGLDALTALAVAGSQVPGIELGTAVVPTYPRHPAVLAQQALTAALAVGPAG